MTNFLKNPAEIRKAVHDLQGDERLDLAIAFIGANWRDLLSGHTGPLRVICWLSSTNTNPYAVDELRKRPFTQVKQRDSMHCKVYLSPGNGAVVGSANLSNAALNAASLDGISGQDEAAVRIGNGSIVGDIEEWFDNLWKDPSTRRITRGDLKAAKDAYDKARARQAKYAQNGRASSNGSMPVVPTSFHPLIAEYAEGVSGLDLRGDIGEACDFVSSIDPLNFTKNDRDELMEYVAAWTKHPGVYKRFRGQPIGQVRTGLELLFDDSIDLQMRLERLLDAEYLRGLQIPSLSLLLYWRDPEHFVPYNGLTHKFLANFDLAGRGMSASSPRCYATWLRWATEVAQRLALPSVGYVDRIVWQYSSDHPE